MVGLQFRLIGLHHHSSCPLVSAVLSCPAHGLVGHQCGAARAALRNTPPLCFAAAADFQNLRLGGTSGWAWSTVQTAGGEVESWFSYRPPLLESSREAALAVYHVFFF
eukprot:gene4488-biopygen18998